MAKLTEKQKRFIDYYIETLNASEAARRAGYSIKTANRIGQENLTKPVIKSAIEERLAQFESERIAGPKEVLKYLTAVMRGEEVEEQIVTVGNGQGESGVEIVKKKVSPKDRIKAAELLGKRYGLQQPEEGLKQNLSINVVYGAPDPPDEDDDS